MRLLALSFIAVAFAGFTSAKPAVPYNAIHGHKLQPKAPKTSAAAALAPKVLAAATTDGNTPFSLTGPKFVSYIDNTSGSTAAASFAVPGSAPANDYNVIILGFWLDSGLYDSGYSWAQLDATTRQTYLNAIHASGKKLLISAFGAAEWPTSGGVNPTTSANNLAAIVKQYGFDGCDIDWEDNNAMDAGTGEAWLITFQTALRAALPSGQYLISHAPQAPYFYVNKAQYPNGAYQTVHKQVGSSIDWYNTQFYNQGSSSYDTCTLLLTASGGAFPGTSLFEIIATGVDSSKLLIGKPATAAGATNTGYMAPSALAACLSQASAKGWSAGVMLWQYTLDTSGSIIGQLAPAVSGSGGSVTTTTTTTTTTTPATTTTKATTTTTKATTTTTKATTTTTTTSASATATGSATCNASNNGAIVCVASGTSASYQTCVNSAWVTQSCGSGTVCKTSGSSIVCDYP